MGGFGSGRQGGSPTVESGLTLDINRLIRQRTIVPARHVSGFLTWTTTRTGEKVASIGYEASLIGRMSPWLRLHYSANGTPQDYRVQIETSPCHYGGVRWWSLCPISGRRTAKLYLPPGATIFAARRTHGLAYRSQRETTIDRAIAQLDQAYRRLGGIYQYMGQAAPDRPKGMHDTTYQRLLADLNAAKSKHNRLFIDGASAILQRIDKTGNRQRENQ